MLVHVSINPKLAILAGKAECGEHTLDLTAEEMESLSPEQRELLASKAGIGAPVSRYYIDRVKVLDLSASGVREGLTQELAELYVEARETAAKNWAKVQKCCLQRKSVEDWLEDLGDDRWSVHTPPVLTPPISKTAAEVLGSLKVVYRQALELRDERNSVREAKYAAIRQTREAKEAAEKEAYVAEQREWIQAHGSRRLRLLQEEKMPLAQTYRAECLALERPGWVWYEDICGKLVPLRDATEEALDVLIAVRETIPEAQLEYLSDDHHLDNCAHHECDSDGNYQDPEQFWARPMLSATFLGQRIVRDVA